MVTKARGNAIVSENLATTAERGATRGGVVLLAGCTSLCSNESAVVHVGGMWFDSIWNELGSGVAVEEARKNQRSGGLHNCHSRVGMQTVPSPGRLRRGSPDGPSAEGDLARRCSFRYTGKT